MHTANVNSLPSPIAPDTSGLLALYGTW